MKFDRRPFITSDEELMRLGMIAPRPFLVMLRPDSAGPRRHWKLNLPAAISYLREQQIEREKGAASGDTETRASADRRALERVHRRSLFP